MHWTGDYWQCNKKDTSCGGELCGCSERWPCWIHIPRKRWLSFSSLGNWTCVMKRKAYRTTSKQCIRVIDLVINPSWVLCSCVCVWEGLHTHTHHYVNACDCVCLRRLSVHTWIKTPGVWLRRPSAHLRPLVSPVLLIGIQYKHRSYTRRQRRLVCRCRSAEEGLEHKGVCFFVFFFSILLWHLFLQSLKTCQ